MSRRQQHGEWEMEGGTSIKGAFMVYKKYTTNKKNHDMALKKRPATTLSLGEEHLFDDSMLNIRVLRKTRSSNYKRSSKPQHT